MQRWRARVDLECLRLHVLPGPILVEGLEFESVHALARHQHRVRVGLPLTVVYPAAGGDDDPVRVLGGEGGQHVAVIPAVRARAAGQRALGHRRQVHIILQHDDQVIDDHRSGQGHR